MCVYVREREGGRERERRERAREKREREEREREQWVPRMLF